MLRVSLCHRASQSVTECRTCAQVNNTLSRLGTKQAVAADLLPARAKGTLSWQALQALMSPHAFNAYDTTFATYATGYAV